MFLPRGWQKDLLSHPGALEPQGSDPPTLEASPLLTYLLTGHCSPDLLSASSLPTSILSIGPREPSGALLSTSIFSGSLPSGRYHQSPIRRRTIPDPLAPHRSPEQQWNHHACTRACRPPRRTVRVRLVLVGRRLGSGGVGRRGLTSGSVSESRGSQSGAARTDASLMSWVITANQPTRRRR